MLTFGPYELLRRLGVGGMGEVFLARLTRADAFEKLLVIKRLLPQYNNDPDLLTLFRSEARLAALLSHQNIVQIFDYGQVDGQNFIAMEFVDGVDATTLLQNSGGALPFSAVLTILIAAVRGIDYAHRKKDSEGQALKLVHRDVNPRNLLISREGEIKWIDFGLARALAKEGTGVHVAGTIAYMSPEQAEGTSLDARSDLFSLGVTAYELLTGHLPFSTTPDFIEHAKFCREQEVSPPSQLNRGCPLLDLIILRTLAPHPEDRYPNARALLEDLSQLAEETPPMSSLRLGRLLSLPSEETPTPQFHDKKHQHQTPYLPTPERTDVSLAPINELSLSIPERTDVSLAPINALASSDSTPKRTDVGLTPLKKLSLSTPKNTTERTVDPIPSNEQPSPLSDKEEAHPADRSSREPNTRKERLERLERLESNPKEDLSKSLPDGSNAPASERSTQRFTAIRPRTQIIISGSSNPPPTTWKRSLWSIVIGVVLGIASALIAVSFTLEDPPVKALNTNAKSPAPGTQAHPNASSLQLESDPSGALVLLDGAEIGRTPLLYPLPRSKEDFTLRLERDGYLPLIEEIHREAGTLVERAFILCEERSFLGFSVHPSAAAAAATLHVEEGSSQQKIEAIDPSILERHSDLEVLPGEVFIRLSSPGYQDWTKIVTLPPGALHVLDVELLPARAVLRGLRSTTKGALIIATSRGRVPVQNYECKTPCSLSLLPGEYSVRATFKNRTSRRVLVRLSPQEKRTLGTFHLLPSKGRRGPGVRLQAVGGRLISSGRSSKSLKISGKEGTLFSLRTPELSANIRLAPDGRGGQLLSISTRPWSRFLLNGKVMKHPGRHPIAAGNHRIRFFPKGVAPSKGEIGFNLSIVSKPF